MRFCPECGTGRQPGDLFCRSCGRHLAEDDARERASDAGRAAPPLLAAAPPPTEPAPRPPPLAPPTPHPPPLSASAPLPIVGAGSPDVHPVAIAGGIAIAIAAFLPWLSALGSSSDGFDVPIAFLWSPEPGQGGLDLGIPLIAIGALGVGLAFRSGTRRIRRSLGVSVVVVAIVFAVQLFRAVGQVGGGFGEAFDFIGVAAYVSIVGGALLAAGR